MIRILMASAIAIPAIIVPASPATAQNGDIAAIEQRMDALQSELDALQAELQAIRAERGGAALANGAVAGRPPTQSAAGAAPLASTDQGPTNAALDTARTELLEDMRIDSESGCPNMFLREAELVTAPSGRAIQDETSSVELRTNTTGSSQAVLQLSAANHYACATEADGEMRQVSELFTFSASAPLGGGATRTDLTSLDGFSDDFRVKIGFVYRNFGFGNIASNRYDDVHRALDIAMQNCAHTRQAAGAQPNLESCIAELNGIASDGLTGQERRENFIARYNPDFDRSALANIGFRSGYAIGLNASLSYDDYSFIDTSTGMRDQTSRVGASIGGFGSLIWPRQGRSLTTGFELRRSYKDQASEAFCSAMTDPDAMFTRCIIGPAGEPRRTDSPLLTVEYRQSLANFTQGVFNGAAIAPQFTYDFEDDQFGIDIPIYLVGDADGGLTGGLRFGYISEDEAANEDDELIFGIFVGAPFSIFD